MFWVPKRTVDAVEMVLLRTQSTCAVFFEFFNINFIFFPYALLSGGLINLHSDELLY